MGNLTTCLKNCLPFVPFLNASAASSPSSTLPAHSAPASSSTLPAHSAPAPSSTLCSPSFIPIHDACAASSSSSTLPAHSAPASSSTLCSPSFIPIHDACAASSFSSTLPAHSAPDSSSTLCSPSFIPIHDACAASSSSSTLPVHSAPTSSSALCSPSFIPLHDASVSSSSVTVPLNNVSASSSSSSPSPSTSYYCQSYDVFINHRGSDVKKTFATRLYRSLHSYGLQAFLDKPEMQVGHEILPQIEAAINVASVHIAIFSPNYAESHWCLKELVLMKNSGAEIIPVFYNVKPSELRWTDKDAKDGTYAKCLRNHEEKRRYDCQKIQEWRDALYHAASLSGLELEEFNGDEEELLDKVVQSVLKIIPKPPLDVAKYPTGLETKIQDLERIVSWEENESPEVKVVAIFGLGGLGKTTLAAEFFNRNISVYNRSSFLFDVREHSARGKLNFLQSKLIKDLTFTDVNIASCAQGKGLLERHLSNCHALIVLDDVGEVDQLDAFLPILRRVLDPKSLILVTSRNWHPLINARISETSIYRLSPLNGSDSKELFCKYAFFEADPPEGFEKLVDGFVAASCGLPLSLKVFGALVCGEDKSYWEEQLGGLHELPEEIALSLKISYDSLNREEQQIFLDIACFSLGEDRDKWIRIWGGSGWKGLVGFRNLQNKCLVEVGSENQIRMHDHLRDLGKSIAQESNPRRLWGATTQNINDLLELSYHVPPQVRGIRMAPRSTLTDTCNDPLFSSERRSSDRLWGINKLQLLEAEGDFVESILTWLRCPNLIWLSWNKCPFSSLPPSLPVRDLRVLEVNGSELKELWQPQSQVPMQLRELNVSAPLLRFPNSLGQLKQLEKLVAEETNLGTLPKEFCYLACLKYLKLKDYKMQILPNSAGKKVTNLQIGQGRGLQNLPDSVGNLTNLQLSDLRQCKSLEMLLTSAAWRRSQIPSGNSNASPSKS